MEPGRGGDGRARSGRRTTGHSGRADRVARRGADRRHRRGLRRAHHGRRFRGRGPGTDPLVPRRHRGARHDRRPRARLRRLARGRRRWGSGRRPGGDAPRARVDGRDGVPGDHRHRGRRGDGRGRSQRRSPRRRHRAGWPPGRRRPRHAPRGPVPQPEAQGGDATGAHARSGRRPLRVVVGCIGGRRPLHHDGARARWRRRAHRPAPGTRRPRVGRPHRCPPRADAGGLRMGRRRRDPRVQRHAGPPSPRARRRRRGIDDARRVGRVDRRRHPRPPGRDAARHRRQGAGVGHDHQRRRPLRRDAVGDLRRGPSDDGDRRLAAAPTRTARSPAAPAP